MRVEINSTPNGINPWYELYKEIQEELDKELLEKLKNDIPNIIAKEITSVQPCPDWNNK